MLPTKTTTMDFKQVIILYLCICTVFCFPSKPLNDRPDKLAWQEWLLIASQDRPPSETERRITPKSVFIAPKLGDNNESLPDCADGYRSDSMGRCIKFVKVDETAHFNFLLERLNAMFATKSGEETFDDNSKPTTGPLQVNIPLGGSGFQSAEELDSNPEIIVVAPTNGNFDVDETNTKIDVKRMHAGTRKSTENKSENDEENEKTTLVTEATTTFKLDNKDYEEDVTETATTNAVDDATQPTINDDLQALFFLIPNNKSEHVENNRTSDILKTSNTPAPTTDASLSVGKTVTDAQTLQTDATTNSTPLEETPNTESTIDMDDVTMMNEPISSLVRFPTDRDTTSSIKFPRDEDYLPESTEIFSGNLPNQNQHSLLTHDAQISTQEGLYYIENPFIGGNPFVSSLPSTEKYTRRRLPSEAVYVDTKETSHPQIPRPQFEHSLSSNNNNEQLFHIRNSDIVSLTSTDRLIVGRPASAATYDNIFVNNNKDLVSQPQLLRSHSTIFNHRNRDKNGDFWRSTTWRGDTVQKPLDFRFSHHSGDSSQGRFNLERSTDNIRYFEDRAHEDFSNVFGRKRRRDNLR